MGKTQFKGKAPQTRFRQNHPVRTRSSRDRDPLLRVVPSGADRSLLPRLGGIGQRQERTDCQNRSRVSRRQSRTRAVSGRIPIPPSELPHRGLAFRIRHHRLGGGPLAWSALQDRVNLPAHERAGASSWQCTRRYPRSSTHSRKPRRSTASALRRAKVRTVVSLSVSAPSPNGTSPTMSVW